MAERAKDTIHVRDLGVRCMVGVFPEERREKQDLLITMALETDLRRAGRTDAVEDTIDYKTLTGRVIAMVEAASFCLIERVAQCVADLCLEDARVRRVEVTVDKPGALPRARCPAVTIVREQCDEESGAARRPADVPKHD